MIPAGNIAPQFPLNVTDPAAVAFIRESARMWNNRGLLDRDEAIGTAHGEVYEHYLETLGAERCEALCVMLANLARTRDWPLSHDCEEDWFNEEIDQCLGCDAEERDREAERLSRIEPEPDDGTTDCPF